jgi:hypothetical protein
MIFETFLVILLLSFLVIQIAKKYQFHHSHQWVKEAHHKKCT